MSLIDITNDRMKLMYGECLERLSELPDGSIDMAACDPPYGTTACKWDSIIPLDAMWEQLKRVIKPNGAIVMTASQPFTTTLIASNMKMFKYCWVWEKNRGSNFGSVKYQPMKEHEDIVVFGKGKTQYFPIKEPRKGGGASRVKYEFNGSNTGKRDTYNGFQDTRKGHREEELRYPSSIQKFNTEVGKHPTQKPVALMEYLIKTYTNKDETVLDFTMGSGTTGVAAMNTGRKFVGIELDANYYAICCGRILEAYA